MKPSNQQYSFTRNYLLAFSELFTKLHVVRYNTDGTEWKYEEVPVIFPFTEKWYAYQKNKWLARADMNEEYIFEISKTLPTISIGEFKMSQTLDNQHPKYETLSTTEGKVIYTPVAFDLSLSVSIITNLLDDNFQIMEQILPYFAPTYNINLNIEEISQNESIPITLTGISNTMPVDMGVEDTRIIQTELNFKMKVNIYPDKLIDPEAYTTSLVIE